MKIIFLLIISILSFDGISQSLQEKEGELATLLAALRDSKNNAEKNKNNSAFKAKLEEAIKLDGAFDYPFSKLTTVGTIKSPDNIIRLFNWNVEQDDETQKYYCYILYNDLRAKKVKLMELKDNSFMLPQRPSDILEADNWYGALYYKIIPVTKASKTFYTVLGWDGNSSMSTIKMIDVLSFTGSVVKIGAPIFKVGKESPKRFFFEYSKKTTMFLNYEEQYNRIIFDHLAPESAALKGLYSMYVPDLSHDAFTWKDGKWVFVEDVIGVNKQMNATITIQVKDEKTGKITEKKIKNKWEEPSKSHVATTPEDQMKESSSSKTVNKTLPSQQSKIPNRKSPQTYNPSSNIKRKK